MLKKERHEKIIDILNQETFMSVIALAELIGVSDMTIRRDIQELEKNKK